MPCSKIEQGACSVIRAKRMRNATESDRRRCGAFLDYPADSPHNIYYEKPLE